MTWPLGGSEAGFDSTLIQTTMFFICEYKLVSIRFHMERTEITSSTPDQSRFHSKARLQGKEPSNEWDILLHVFAATNYARSCNLLRGK